MENRNKSSLSLFLFLSIFPLNIGVWFFYTDFELFTLGKNSIQVGGGGGMIKMYNTYPFVSITVYVLI